MRSVSLLLLGLNIIVITTPCFAKKQDKEIAALLNEAQSLDNSSEEYHPEVHGYQPNPVILNGVGQIMNGALSIAQNPHSRPNIGHSIAGMIYGIMSIIVEKIAHKKMDPTHLKALEECCDEICTDISKEITEIIITKGLLLP